MTSPLQSLTPRVPIAPREIYEGQESAGVPASLLEYLHACPVCAHPHLRHYCRVPSLFQSEEFIRYERCAGCGTVVRNPRLPPSYRLERYEEVVLPEEKKRLVPRNQAHYAFMMRRIAHRLRRVGPAPGDRPLRLLDFGCGSGGFLVEARAAGFEVMGLELNRDLARHVEQVHGIPVHQGLISDPEFAGERFDVIITSQVFEHLLDPAATLRELRRHLLPGGPGSPAGLILIEVPNLLDFRERLRRGSMMDDSHLFYFTAASLGRLLRDGGFRVLEVRQGLRPYRALHGARGFQDLERRAPLWLLDGAERLMSLCGVRTGLSVLARAV
jgi:SAM-dependent methyltransferase